MNLPPTDREKPPVVAVVTDFGRMDVYVYEMISALRQVCSNADVREVTHDLPPGGIAEGAYVVGRIARLLKDRDILLAIVDPGVGGKRQAIAARSGGKLFVGPDNGLFARAMDWDGGCEVRSIGWADVPGKGRSATFHGRDLFSPVAGRLAAGEPLDSIGIPAALLETRKPPAPFSFGGKWFGRVVHIDRFGNLTTDITPREGAIVQLRCGQALRQASCYEDIPAGEMRWLVGSDGSVEIAGRRRRADLVAGTRIGERVTLVGGASGERLGQ